MTGEKTFLTGERTAGTPCTMAVFATAARTFGIVAKIVAIVARMFGIVAKTVAIADVSRYRTLNARDGHHGSCGQVQRTAGARPGWPLGGY